MHWACEHLPTPEKNPIRTVYKRRKKEFKVHTDRSASNKECNMFHSDMADVELELFTIDNFIFYFILFI